MATSHRMIWVISVTSKDDASVDDGDSEDSDDESDFDDLGEGDVDADGLDAGLVNNDDRVGNDSDHENFSENSTTDFALRLFNFNGDYDDLDD